MEHWKEQGVPLELVLKGIDRAFSKPKRIRKLTRLAYCVKAVEQVIEENKNQTIEAPPLPDFDETEVKQYVGRLADDVSRVDDGIAASIRNLDVSGLAKCRTVTKRTGGKLIAKLKFTADDATMVNLKREIDEEFTPFRSTMTAAQLVMLEQQMWRRKLLERFNVPRLSLFYLI